MEWCGAREYYVYRVDDALPRVGESAYSLENARAEKAFGTPGRIGKNVIPPGERTAGGQPWSWPAEHRGTDPPGNM
jgi:hypothetical protein